MRGRGRGARILVAVLLGVVLARLLVLQIVRREHYGDLARSNILREEVLPAIRGVIRDCRGRILVDSVPSFTLAINPLDRAYLDGDADLETTLETLAPLVHIDASEMIVTVEQEKRRSYRPVRLKRHLSEKTVAYIEERRDRLPGVVVEHEPMRRSVHGDTLAHVLGYVGEVSGAEIGRTIGARTYRRGDQIGRSGIERRYEAELSGQNGRRLVEVNALGRRLPRGSYATVEPPTHGQDLVLSIDLAVQRAAAMAFPDSMSGAVVVLDVESGGILAILSRPTFDPNEFAHGMTRERWREFDADPAHPLHDRALMAAYPPGSVFKVVTAVAALSLRRVGLHERLDIGCAGGMKFGNRWFGCHHQHGVTAFESAMTMSCDVYFYQLGLRLGVDGIHSFASAAGFGAATGFELHEVSGLVPDRDWYDNRFGKRGWTQGNILNLSIGQGEVLATPLQLAQLMGLVARDWEPLVPYIVERVGGEGRRPVPPPQGLAVEPLVQRALVRALEQVVIGERGTARRARVRGVRVAGKTGTSQNPHGEDHALFAGFAPVDAPRIAFAIVVEHGGHGGATAAPVAAAIVRACLGEDPIVAAGGTVVPPAVPGGD